MATDKNIRYTASIDDNPFAAATRRIGAHLQGLQVQQAGLGRSWNSVSEGMAAHVGKITESVASGVSSMGGHFGGLLENLGRTRGGLLALVGAAAALAASKAVSATAAMTESAMDLGRVLGTSTNEAQRWRIALEDVGATQGDLEGAAKGMSRQLKENEDDMKAMGLQTRDAAGNLRPMTELLTDGIEILNQHKEGADRALASQQLFGRGVDASSKLLLINKEALEEAQSTMQGLGLEVGANAVAAWKNWDAATDRAGFSLKGLVNTVGSILMPILTDLVNVFNAVMPAAIVIVRGALGGLATAFHAIKNGVIVVWEVVNAFVISVAEPIRAVVEALGRAMVGDFSGAATVIKSVPATITGAWSRAMDNIAENSERTRERIAAIWMPDSTPGEPVGSRGTKTYKPPPDKKKEKADPSDMPFFEAALAQIKLNAAEQDALREFSKQQELDYWRTILENTEISSKDRVAIQRKAADLDVAVRREQAQRIRELGRVELQQWQDTELAKIALAEDAARTAVELGQGTAEQLLAQEQQFEIQRMAIKRAALEASLATLDPERDPVKRAEVNAQIEALELAHQLKLQQIRGQVAKNSAAEQRAVWEDLGNRMSNLWDAGIQAMMNGTLRWSNAMRAVGAELLGWMAGMVKRQVATWVFGEQAKTGATQAGTLQRWAMESWAAAKSVALWAATAVKNIMVSAWEAMAGAWKAIVGIPYVGPVLAPIAAAAAFAGVSSLASNVLSAEGGFDIPRGVNPMVQLHEQEMVLPARHAEVIRNLADGAGGSGGPLTVELKGVPMPGNFFMVHRADLVAAIKSARRDNALPS